ncbi:MAG: PepSY domain-containing protein [Betaproteobacteria bacterium]|nr:PepSY domain-containing protein [Betaproteobacteria bacterium]
MKLATMLSSIALAGAFAVGGAVLAPSFAGESRTAPAGERQWLSIPQVHQKLEAAGYRQIEKIEREHGGYEARATDRQGQRIKLHINPQTGEIIDRGAHAKQAKGAQPASGDNRRNSADCNERRCRDDLPQKSVPATPIAPTSK